MSRALSEVVRKFIVGELRGETAGEIVVPSCDPAAQVGNPRFIKPVFREVLVGEDTNASEMVQNRLQVEVRVMPMGEILEIGL